MTPPSTSSTALTFHERLWPGPLGWVGVVAFGVVLGAALYPVDSTVAVVVGLVGLVIGLVAMVRWTPTVAVVDGELRAGDAHIPLALLGEVRPLDAEATRVELGPALDARAYVCLRAWARTGVRAEVLDPADPTPYWLVSTRRPAALARAVAQERTSPGE
ncbi:DUF3093 domain-containing protein [Cellulomonas fimi]|uniref:DUF3093 domain-containing protein n=1 Tax=Cellulomonas fimi TaxID=1708 RepID=A0A7Y0QGR5_CELFI|nr:DUF3093 domain-containing protein [Cellulomonas fimi]NMR19383.1 DUF3093 domain-containing protein [Cellulomonas fimi]